MWSPPLCRVDRRITDFEGWLRSILRAASVSPECSRRVLFVALLPLPWIIMISDASRDIEGAPGLFTLPEWD